MNAAKRLALAALLAAVVTVGAGTTTTWFTGPAHTAFATDGPGGPVDGTGKK
jgi:hypothetical protein